jgi:hypothetical protein
MLGDLVVSLKAPNEEMKTPQKCIVYLAAAIGGENRETSKTLDSL